MARLQQVDVVDAQPLQVAVNGRLDVRARDARLPVRPQVLVSVPRHLPRRTHMKDLTLNLSPVASLQAHSRVLYSRTPPPAAAH